MPDLSAALTPVHIGLTAVKGGNYAAEIGLWEDEGHTQPFDLAGWTISLRIDQISSPEIEVTTSGNIVTMKFPWRLTDSYPTGSFHYVLWIEKEQVRLPPVSGTFTVEDA